MLSFMMRRIKSKLYMNSFPVASFLGGSITIHTPAADQTRLDLKRLATFYLQHPLSPLSINN